MIRIGKAQEASLIMKLTEGFKFEPLVTGLIERGSVGMIVGPAKSKKSMLALNLAFSAVEGVPFLSHECKGGERVLYVNLELTQPALGVRLRAMNRFYKSRSMSRMAFLSADEFTGGEPLVDVKDRKVNKSIFDQLTECAREWKASVVVIDPLYYVVGEENDNVLVTEVLKQFSRLRDETACTVIVVHHTRKERTDWSDPFQAGRGASSIGGFFEWVLGIQPDDDGLGAILHHGSRNLRTAPDIRMRFVEDSLTWRAAGDASPDEILDKAMGDELEMPYLDFVAAAKAAGVQSKERVDELLEGSKTLLRIKAHRGQKAVVRRVFDGVLPGF
jgi:KaiC/GvpD/RAD55 family RecA-like ATPase